MAESIRVLHVDDDPRFSSLTAEMLEGEDQGFDVETETDPRDGLDRLAEASFDCIVSDYEMPGMNGIDFLATVRGEQPDLPFILFTGKGSEEVASAAISAGVTDYLQKDDTVEQYDILKNRIENAVSAYRSEQVAADRLHRLEQVVKTVPEAITRLNRDGEIVYANQHAESHLGLEPSDVRERTYNDPDWQIRDLDGEPIPDEELPFRQVVETGEPVEGYRHSIEFPDGERRIVEINGAPIFDGKEIDGVVFAITDITERQRRQNALEALHDIATTIQGQDSVEAVSERTVSAAADILDFDTCSVMIREDEWLVPYAVSEQTPPGGVRRMKIDEGLAGKTFQTGDPEFVEQVSDDDETKPAKDSYQSGVSVPIGEYGVFQAVRTESEGFDESDIEFVELLLSHTESRIAQIERQKALERQNERLDEFAGIVSHDLANPLNVAQLHLDLARDSVDHESLEAVARAHDRMETLIDALLTLARSGDSIEELQSVQLSSAVETCLESVSTSETDLVVESDAVVHAEVDLLGILLENLLKNSVEHAAAPKESTDSNAAPSGVDSSVTVRVGVIDETGFFVADDGPGIPDDIAEKIFESGFTTESGGTGFGLKIVSEIVDVHDWSIDVTESESGGARFEITGVDIG